MYTCVYKHYVYTVHLIHKRAHVLFELPSALLPSPGARSEIESTPRCVDMLVFAPPHPRG